MTDPRQPATRPAAPELRTRAEAAVRASSTDIVRMSRQESLELVHELQIHQIELEMLNEEHRHAQQALNQSRDRFAQLYDFAPVGYLTLDPTGAVLEANLSLATLLGVERGKLVGSPFTRFVSYDAQDTFYYHQRAVLDSGAKQTCELDLRRADGTRFSAQLETMALHDTASGSWNSLSAISDISTRKQAELALKQLNATLEQRVQARTAELTQANADLQAAAAAKEVLRESEERLITVAENLSEGLCITSMEGEFIHWNHAALEMHGIASLAECKGQLANFTQLIEIKTLDGATLPLDQWPMSRALRGEVVRDCELHIRRTDTGMERILSYSGTAVRDSTGKQSAFLTVTDITERKRAEAQLRELNETLERRVLERTRALAEMDSRKDEFLAMLGHELRNPLAALSNAVQLMRRHKHEDPLLLQGRAIIGRQLGHLIHLVDDLLDVSRITSGSVRLRQKTVNLSGIVERALETA